MTQKEKYRVAIIDDEPNRSGPWADKIQGYVSLNASVVALPKNESKDAISQLFKRRNAIRDAEGHSSVEKLEIPCQLDDVDILVLDYDLRYFDEGNDNEWTTGAEVAIAARAFSTVGMVVLVNRVGRNGFDLSMKSSTSPADLDIGDVQVLNPNLWGGINSNEGGFHPWSWPNFFQWVDHYSDSITWVKEHLESNIFTSLGFHLGEGPIGHELSREQWTDLGVDPGTCTFRQLVQKHQFLSLRDRDVVAADANQCARVAVGIIREWLDRIVVPSQDTLIDAAHLAYQMPWLLKSPTDLSCWDMTASSDSVSNAFKIDLNPYAFVPEFLLSRPAFFRREVECAPGAEEPGNFNYNEIPDVVFCEDISKFIAFDKARPFPSALPCLENQRYVANPEKIDSPTGPRNLKDIAYEPASLFAL